MCMASALEWTTAIGSVLAAVGAVSAAVVALKIASDSRNDARRASDESREAQARLVRVTIDGVAQQRAFAVDVENWGALSILDVALVGARFESRHSPPPPSSVPALTSTSNPIPVLVPKSREALAPRRFMVDFRSGDRSVLIRDDSIGYDPINSSTTTVHATIEFTDAYGAHWRQSTEGTPTRIKARSAGTLHTAS